MSKKKSKLRSFGNVGVAILSSCAIMSCGGGDSAAPADEVPAPTVVSGVFLDSAVAGLAYMSGGQSGITGVDGSFSCEAGEPVTFLIGGRALSSTTCGADMVATPLSLFGVTDSSDTRVQNLARLLQTLDNDGNPDNGIEIVIAVHATTANMPAAWNFSSATFDADVTAFITDVATAGDTTNSTLVSAVDAKAHLDKQFSSIAGAWKIPGEPVIITFFADGTYVQFQDGIAEQYAVDDSSSDVLGTWGSGSMDPVTGARTEASITFSSNGTYQHVQTGPAAGDGFTGWERGSYSATLTDSLAGTKTYTFNSSCPTDDSNGEWGLSHPNGVSCTGIQGTLAIADGNELSIHPTCDPQSACSSAAVFRRYAGIERGTYTWDSSTGAFTSTCPSVDTNGDVGLSHPDGVTCTGTSATITVLGNTMSLTPAGGSAMAIQRVVNATLPIVGSWSVSVGGADITFTFLTNGVYMHTQAGTAGAFGTTGMERGTYTWNETTGALVTTCPVIDTNGEWGMSHPNGDVCTGTTATATVSGNTLTFDFGGGSTFALARVVP